MECAILRMKQLQPYTNISRSLLYVKMKEADFPRPVRLGPRTVGWRKEEIDAWLQSRERGSISAPARKAA